MCLILNGHRKKQDGDVYIALTDAIEEFLVGIGFGFHLQCFHAPGSHLLELG